MHRAAAFMRPAKRCAGELCTLVGEPRWYAADRAAETDDHGGALDNSPIRLALTQKPTSH
jgi:hypothetical protein